MKIYIFHQFLTLFLIIFLGFVVQCSSAENFEKIFSDCKQETNVSSEIVQKVIADDINFDDHSGKCFQRCLSIKMGLCDEKYGKFVPEAYIEMKPFLSTKKVR